MKATLLAIAALIMVSAVAANSAHTYRVASAVKAPAGIAEAS